ncbi:MAG: 8-amino-7-oxononanoate synthase [Planctomycetaceae bacterium]|jgi:8-amino-7-oxononanoate synthase|nr:8-amino-7-oxononanoate synthase [Planctomycetaceae bacterium]
MPSPLDWIPDDLSHLREESLYREPRNVTALGDGRCEIDGRVLIDFGSNDYLNLATSDALKDAATVAIQKHGLGARASSLVSGRHPEYQTLCRRLTDFEHADDALLFPTGYMANVGTITALVGSEDSVFCDRLNHASLVDGCRLSKAKFRVYPHRDLTVLNRELEKASGVRRKLIVTDGVFSMDGDLAPLPELWEIAHSHNAMLLVDEAHATGVFGKNGRGSVEHFDLEDQPIIRVGTLSKAIGCLGGFVTGSQDLTDYLRNKAGTQVYSTGLPAVICAAASAAVQEISENPAQRKRLQSLSDLLRTVLSAQNIDYAPGSCGPIVPVILDDAEVAVSVSCKLQEAGFFVPAIRPPTVPAGTSRLRITVSTAHAEDDLRSLVSQLRGML